MIHLAEYLLCSMLDSKNKQTWVSLVRKCFIDGDYVQIMVTTMFVRIYILYTNKKKNMNNREEGFYLHGYHYVP